MSNEIRDPDDLIHAYVRGRLSEAECTAVEQSLSDDPTQWREFERVFRAREGLAHLKERGDLTRLLEVAPWYRRAPALAAAAALASVAVGTRLLLDSAGDSKDPGLSTSRSGGTLAASILLARTRGSDVPTIEKPVGGLLELHVRPEYRAAQFYNLHMTLPAVAAGAPKVLTAQHLPLDPDGNVTVYLSAGDLPAGEYSVRITADVDDSTMASDFEFRIEDAATTH